MVNLDKKLVNKVKKQQYYTTEQLAQTGWLLTTSAATIRTLIKNGMLKAINVSTIKGKVKWKISREAVIEYIKNLK